ncbi:MULTISPECIES: HNH endonuclease signature motif containing protein [unclassified Arthrobacter]|uniref:HNH endonuclease signature motif containing protein n=1 Tax=unclassified Arthrobacter TaxID=235627 RepID=UPI001CE31B2D|nr:MULTISPECIES: HNH endonuclease signature motif containing protein [unclassified Arthrobacter]
MADTVAEPYPTTAAAPATTAPTGPTTATKKALPSGESAPLGDSVLTGWVSLSALVDSDASQTLEVMKALDGLRSWVDAQEAKAVTHLWDLIRTECPGVEEAAQDLGRTLTATEIGAALRLPDRTAGALIENSEFLVRDYQSTLRALEDGKITRRHAVAVVGEAISIPDTAPGVCAGFEAQLIDLACELTVAKFSYQAVRLRETLHPESITVRRRKAIQDRRVYVAPDYDGMAWLHAFLPTEQVAGIFHRVDTAARHLQGAEESRTLTQLRTDVLIDVLTSAGATGHIADGDSNPTGPKDSSAFWGVQAKVFVTVPVSTLLGGDVPGELEGYGPIDPETARRLAGHAPSFTRILTHPFTGARLGADATTYRVPKDLQDAVRVRDRTCRHPGCNRLAVFCELDHTTPWSHGGKTSYGNLAALCKRHHKLKSEGFWHYRQPEPGMIIATSPAGHTYVTRPDPPPAPLPEEPPPF